LFACAEFEFHGFWQPFYVAIVCPLAYFREFVNVRDFLWHVSYLPLFAHENTLLVFLSFAYCLNYACEPVCKNKGDHVAENEPAEQHQNVRCLFHFVHCHFTVKRVSPVAVKMFMKGESGFVVFISGFVFRVWRVFSSFSSPIFPSSSTAWAFLFSLHP
jgi:hypothetical protein